MLITGNQQLLRKTSRMALVRMLTHAPPLSRADLAVALGLSKSNISPLVRERVDGRWLNQTELVVTGCRGFAQALIGSGFLANGTRGDAPAKRRKALDKLFAAARAGVGSVHKALRSAGRHLGELLNNLWVSFDPTRIAPRRPRVVNE